mmetsp:Transcript_88274/g.234726  ORF Transcript_88274/g.234726 Transcript_88274/m.234726 type:complete len:366 (-) Transcript_88274:143-1240(-)
MMTSLTVAPPLGMRARHSSWKARRLLKTYIARGCLPEIRAASSTAWSRLLTGIMERMGAKASSCMRAQSRASSVLATRTTVGATYRASGSVCPPWTTRTLPAAWASLSTLWARRTAAGEMRRPRSGLWDGSGPNICSRLRMIADSSLLATLSMTSTYSGATHTWPALMVRPQAMRRAATSRDSRCSSTTTGFLPPSSSTQGVRRSAAALATILPTRMLPVKRMKSHGSANSAVVSGTPPVTTRKHRLSRYCGTKRVSSAVDSMQASLGLRTAQFPAAMAPRSGLSNIATGKLKGPKIRTTPYGSYRTSDFAGAIRPMEACCSWFIQPFNPLRTTLAEDMMVESSVRSASIAGFPTSLLIAVLNSS